MDVVTLGAAKSYAKRFRPYNNHAVLFGDSMTHRCGSGDEARGSEKTLYHDSRSWFHWAMTLMGSPLRMTRNAGVGGDTTQQMLARMDADVLSLDPLPYWLFGFGGVNNQGTGSAGAITALKSIFDKWLATGGEIVWMTVLPDRGNTGQRNVVHEINDWLRQYAQGKRGFHLHDWTTVMLEPATGNPRIVNGLDYTSDGLHLSPYGAAVAGQSLADFLTPLIARRNLGRIPTETGVSVAANVGLTGGTTNATGWTPAGWSAYKDPADDHQVLVATSGSSTFMQIINPGASTFGEGDRIWGELVFEADDDWIDTTDFSVDIQLYGVDTYVNRTVGMMKDATVSTTVSARRGRITTPRITIPPGCTQARIYLRMTGGGTVHVYNLDVRKERAL